MPWLAAMAAILSKSGVVESSASSPISSKNFSCTPPGV